MAINAQFPSWITESRIAEAQLGQQMGRNILEGLRFQEQKRQEERRIPLINAQTELMKAQAAAAFVKSKQEEYAFNRALEANASMADALKLESDISREGNWISPQSKAKFVEFVSKYPSLGETAWAQTMRKQFADAEKYNQELQQIKARETAEEAQIRLRDILGKEEIKARGAQAMEQIRESGRIRGAQESEQIRLRSQLQKEEIQQRGAQELEQIRLRSELDTGRGSKGYVQFNVPGFGQFGGSPEQIDQFASRYPRLAKYISEADTESSPFTSTATVDDMGSTRLTLKFKPGVPIDEQMRLTKQFSEGVSGGPAMTLPPAGAARNTVAQPMTPSPVVPSIQIPGYTIRAK